MHSSEHLTDDLATMPVGAVEDMHARWGLDVEVSGDRLALFRRERERAAM